MRKFKTGDKIVRVYLDRSHAPIGYKATVLEGYQYLCKDGELVHIREHQWKLAELKWSIYNNTLPWSQLSDKQKGKLLVANNNGLIFKGFTALFRPNFGYNNVVHTVTKPETVKPEPTMVELFKADFYDSKAGSVAEYMIAKGWSKS
jgi:hypothetical protein